MRTPPPRTERCVIVAGALGQGNIGDDALAATFLKLHGSHYGDRMLLSGGQSSVGAIADVVRPPPLAIGRRIWYGLRERRSTSRAIKHWRRGRCIDYVWVGGLLGHPGHVPSRLKELAWASTLASRFVYYFGDVEERFREARHARALIDVMNRLPKWVAVRSREAADILRESGLQGEIHVGVDAVLHDLMMLPSPRRRMNRGGHVGLAPFGPLAAQDQPLWYAAAAEAAQRGLAVVWLACASADDMQACKQLSSRFAEDFPAVPQRVLEGEPVREAIATSEVCVSTRYHGAIFGLGQRVPTIAISRHEKVRRLYELLGAKEWLVNAEEHGPEKVSTLVRAALLGGWTTEMARLDEPLAAHRRALDQFTRSFCDTAVNSTSRQA